MGLVEKGFSLCKSEAICSITESEIIRDEGEKLNEMPDGVGTEFVQFIAQHNRAILAS